MAHSQPYKYYSQTDIAHPACYSQIWIKNNERFYNSASAYKNCRRYTKADIPLDDTRFTGAFLKKLNGVGFGSVRDDMEKLCQSFLLTERDPLMEFLAKGLIELVLNDGSIHLRLMQLQNLLDHIHCGFLDSGDYLGSDTLFIHTLGIGFHAYTIALSLPSFRSSSIVSLVALSWSANVNMTTAASSLSR